MLAPVSGPATSASSATVPLMASPASTPISFGPEVIRKITSRSQKVRKVSMPSAGHVPWAGYVAPRLEPGVAISRTKKLPRAAPASCAPA